MKKAIALLLALVMCFGLAACGGSSNNSGSNNNNASKEVSWPGTDNDITIYTRNSAGGAPFLGQQYFMDIVFKDAKDASYLLVDDATSGGAVCVDKTYAAGGDGYTFYVAGSEVVIGDILGTFDHSMKNDFIPLGALPSNGAPNYLCISKKTLPDVKTFQDFVDWCKAHPGEFRLGYGPNAIGEVICKLIMDHYGLDVKWVISEGNDNTTNIMGGIIDGYLFNQTKTLSLMQDTVTPVLAASTLPVNKTELKGIPNYKDLGIEELFVPTGMYLIAKNDMDPELAKAINAKLMDAANKVNNNDSDETVQILKKHMTTQEQVVEAKTIDQCWEDINALYKAIDAVLGKK